jgi:hypothetical protein
VIDAVMLSWRPNTGLAGAPSAARGRQDVTARRKQEDLMSQIPMRRSRIILVSTALLVALLHPVDQAAAAGPNVGDKAPDFTLPATTGESITLSQFRGKRAVLLEFYGADFSPV